MKRKQYLKGVRNNRGVALVVVLMVYVVMSILGVSAVSMVYSDNMFSQRQEDTKQAQYVARSAVTIVEEAIRDKLEDLALLKTALEDAIDAYAAATTPAARDAKEVLLQEAEDDYNDLYEEIYGTAINVTILPYISNLTSITHDVVVSGQDFEVDNVDGKIPVQITYLSAGLYRMVGEATVNGKTGKAIRILDVDHAQESLDVMSASGLFDNALFALESINVEKNNSVFDGDVSYGSGDEPDIDITNGEIGTHGAITLPTAQEYFDLLTDTEVLANNSSITFYTNTGTAKKPIYTSTPANNYKYTASMNWNKTYNINTTSGDVMLRFSNVNITSNQVIFNVTGGNDLIVFIENITSSSVNNLEFVGNGDSDIHLIFAGDAAQFAKNNIYGDNLYIYAPTSDLLFQNNIGGPGNGQGKMKGAIIGMNITFKNNADIVYLPPSNNVIFGTMTEIVGTITLETLSLGTGSRWSKD